MRKGWEIKTLSKVCKTGAGGTPLKSHKDFYEGGTIPWLMSGEVSQGEIFEAQNFITEKGLNNSSARLFPVNTVLIAMYGATAGQVGILRFEASTNQAVCGILPNEKMIPEYLFYCFLSKKEELISQASGNAQPNISQIKIKNTKIPIPPLVEQQRIVSILDEAFAAIDQAKENTKRNLQNAKDLFQSELNAVFSNKGEGWVERKLGEVALTFGRGKSKHRPRNDEKLYGGKYPFIQTGDVRNSDKYILKYSQTYNELGLTQSKIWPKGTICITIAANIAETGILNFDSCFPDSIIGIVVDPKKAEVNFTYYALQFLKTKLQLLGKGSAQDNINLGTFETQTFPFPSLTDQKQIVHQLDTLSAETKKLESLYQQKLNNLEDLKKSVLEKAFKGELKEIQLSEL